MKQQLLAGACAGALLLASGQAFAAEAAADAADASASVEELVLYGKG